MQLKPKIIHVQPKVLGTHIEDIMKSPGKFITQEQLAEILELSVKQAIIKAVDLGF